MPGMGRSCTGEPYVGQSIRTPSVRSALPDFIDAGGCRRYIHSRQTPQGGFCFYRYPSWGVEEPNAPDTWAALASLALLDETPRHAQLITKWLREQQDGNGGFPTLIIAEAVLEALRLLDAMPVVEPQDYLSRQASRMASAYTDTMDPAAWLGSVHRYVRLLRNSGLPFHALEGQACTGNHDSAAA